MWSRPPHVQVRRTKIAQTAAARTGAVARNHARKAKQEEVEQVQQGMMENEMTVSHVYPIRTKCMACSRLDR